MRETHKHQRKSNHQTLLFGDLNSSWIDSNKGGTHPALQRWANRTGWQNPERALADQHPGARICTNWASITPVSWIDHIILYQAPSMLSLLGSHLARAPTTTSDKHRLYWNSFRVPGAPHNNEPPSPRPTTRRSARFPTYLKTNPLRTNTKPTCRNGSARTLAPPAHISVQTRPARTYNKSAKPLLQLT